MTRFDNLVGLGRRRRLLTSFSKLGSLGKASLRRRFIWLRVKSIWLVGWLVGWYGIYVLGIYLERLLIVCLRKTMKAAVAVACTHVCCLFLDCYCVRACVHARVCIVNNWITTEK